MTTTLLGAPATAVEPSGARSSANFAAQTIDGVTVYDLTTTH
ncbi:hypothetical protein [Nocardia anaemiae]|nr:hypothetical protein [Nocardia anaemiae]